MSTRVRSAGALAGCLALVAVITACIPTGSAPECAGQVTTTTVVDCAWTTSTTATTDPPASTTPTDPSVPTSIEPTTSSTTTEPSTTTTSMPTTTTTRAPGDLDHPWWAYKGNLAGPKVLVIGDSITALSAPAINAALHPTYATQVIGLGGVKLAGAEYYLEPYPASNPDVVLIGFGTNDGNRIVADTTGATRERWKATYVEIAARFPAGTCFAPVTMPASRGATAWDASQAELNEWLLATFPNTVDWNAFELGQRAAGYRLLDTDLIHPTGLGFSTYAAMMLGGAARCLAGR